MDNPKTYNNLKRKNKFMGIIDYRTLLVLLIYVWMVWKISTCIFKNYIYSGYMCIFLVIPVIGLIYANRYEDDILHVIYVIIKYVFSPKLYTFRLKGKKYWQK